MLKFRILTALFNFAIAAAMGLLLRGAWVWEIEWLDYKNMLHAHSHVAMLGWIYLILFALISDRFVPPEKQRAKKYGRLFWFTQAAVIGMMVGFPVQGYGAISIAFSTLHVFASYFFIYRIVKDAEVHSPQVSLLLRFSLFFLAFSTLGLWAMGPLMAQAMQNHPLYFAAVQFYLHFQFNGWFILGILALVFHHMGLWGYVFEGKSFRYFIVIYLTAVLLSFCQVLFWAYGLQLFFYLNAAGVVSQFAAFAVLLWPIRNTMVTLLQERSRTVRALFAFGTTSLLLKVGIQLALISPEIAILSTTIRNFLIGYIHLITLGVISAFAFMILADKRDTALSAPGLWLFAVGIAGSETVLFVQGLRYWLGWGMMPSYYSIIAAASALMLVGIALIFVRYSLKKDKNTLKSSETDFCHVLDDP